MTETFSVRNHFINKDPSVRALYDQLLSILRTFGPVVEDPKKTSIHYSSNSSLPVGHLGSLARSPGSLMTKADVSSY